MAHRFVGARVTAAGVALAAVALAGAPALGFCRLTTCAISKPPADCFRDGDGCWAAGIPLFWEQPCVSYSLAEAASPRLGLTYASAEEIVGRGFNLWPLVTCPDGQHPSIALMNYGPMTCDRVAYYSSGPNSNGIMFRDSGWRRELLAIALTSVMFNSRTGKILGADMEINSESYPLSPADLAYVVAHEAGHFLGLDHSPDPASLMYATYELDATMDPVLQLDDVAAICAAYPPPAASGAVPPTCDFEPEKGFAPDCGGNVVGGCGLSPAPLSPRRSAAALAALLAMAALAALTRRSPRAAHPEPGGIGRARAAAPRTP